MTALPPRWWPAFPKVELHCHIAGTLRPQTLAALAAQYGLALPRAPEQLYVYRDFYVSSRCCWWRRCCTPADFGVAYEAIEDAYRRGNVQRIEMAFNLKYFAPTGTAYRTQVDGTVAGIEEAEQDFGVSALLLAFDREWSPASAGRSADEVLASPASAWWASASTAQARRAARDLRAGNLPPRHAGRAAQGRARLRTTKRWRKRRPRTSTTASTCCSATGSTTATTCWPRRRR